eukprot:scaffold67689_cov30-Phaeocystis_antarctica.AAC.1
MQRRSSARQSHLSALTQGQCWDYLAERCRGALERGGVPQRRRRPSARNEPFAALFTEIEMQPAAARGARDHTRHTRPRATGARARRQSPIVVFGLWRPPGSPGSGQN